MYNLCLRDCLRDSADLPTTSWNISIRSCMYFTAFCNTFLRISVNGIFGPWIINISSVTWSIACMSSLSTMYQQIHIYLLFLKEFFKSLTTVFVGWSALLQILYFLLMMSNLLLNPHCMTAILVRGWFCQNSYFVLAIWFIDMFQNLIISFKRFCYFLISLRF